MKIKDTRITLNRARCKLCGHTITSTHVHDYKHCKCGEIMVDGGKDYLRRGWHNSKDNIIELSEFEEYERDPYPWEKEVQTKLNDKSET